MVGGLSLILFIVACSIPPASRAARPLADTSPRLDAIAVRADSLFQISRGDSALSLLRAAISEARDQRFHRTLLRLLLADAGIRCTIGSGPALAEAESREALLLARAARDGAGQCQALRWLSVSLGSQLKSPEGGDSARELLKLATALGNREFQGHAWLGIAGDDLLGARFQASRENFGKAAAIFRELELTYWELWAVQGTGRAYTRLEDIPAARKCFEDVVARGHEAGLNAVEATALNNLGVLEFTRGNPAMSIGYYRRALDLHRQAGSHQQCAVDMRNIAIVYNWLGHWDDAEALLDSLATMARLYSLRAEQAKALVQLGSTYLSEKRYLEAARRSREGLALLGLFHADGVLVLSEALAKMDSLAAAEQVITDNLDRYGDMMTPGDRTRVLVGLGRVLCRLGRYEEVVDRLRTAASTSPDIQVSCCTLRGAALLRMGLRDSARAELDRARSSLDADRARRSDRVWRLITHRDQKMLFSSLADLELGVAREPGPAATEKAFDLVQGVRARGLYEVMSSLRRKPEGPMSFAEPVTLRELQSVLLPGELFIDMLDGGDEVVLFAVTSERARAVRLEQPDRQIVPRVSLYRRFLEGRAGLGQKRRGGEADLPGLALAGVLFGGIGDMLAESHRVLIAPDGPLYQISMGSLPLPLPPNEGGEPLLVRHEVCSVPSAAFLVALRRRQAERRIQREPLILAWAGPASTTGESSGVIREVAWMARHLPHVTTRGLPGDPVDPPTPGDLAAYSVIHLAGHARVDDFHPWESGILLPGKKNDERAVGFSASQVLDLGLTADLAVLSGCRTAGGRVLGGEGVVGLTSSFLLSGVNAVVGTLSDVDDPATERLMVTFYKRLIRGETPARALAGAQDELRRSREFGHPRYWSPFILVGDGAATVRLRE